MRLYFELSPNTEPVPWDYQHFLIGTLHKWLGRNELHDGVSLYSMSWLSFGEQSDGSLNFSRGTKWFISFFDPDVCKRTLSAVLEDPDVCCGMRVTDVHIRENPTFDGAQRFLVATPVLVRTFDGKAIKHLTYDDADVNRLLTQTLQTKLKQANRSDPTAQVEFDRTYQKAKTKLVMIKGIRNRASLCPVIVKGSPETLSFVWDVGVGHSTGSGFGALC
ncbi:MAG: CRISPR-associated endoribonuclease Cas6 [Bacteroidetes bacterium]|nr:CRISPR-associated endoribonuclease Cas6 [Bacteroidota bacterium]MCW5896732.1 CRISPR-associated endoribonuclease Cas6 [Bacteroidota bacterium]